MGDSTDFWFKLDQLVAASNLKVDRPGHHIHVIHPSFIPWTMVTWKTLTLEMDLILMSG